VFGILSIVVVIPLLKIYLICFKNQKQLRQKRLLRTLGALYKETKYDSKIKQACMLNYFIRRILYVAIGLGIKDFNLGGL